MDVLLSNVADRFKSTLEGIKAAYDTKSEFEQFMENAKDGVLSFEDKFKSIPDVAKEYFEGKLNGLKQFIIDSYCNGGINIKKVESSLMVQDAEFNMAQTMYEFFIPLGMIMLVIYLLLDILNTTTSRIREFDIKSFMMIFLKGAIGLIFLKYGYYIMASLLSVANSLVLYACGEGPKVMIDVGSVSGSNSAMAKYYSIIVAGVADLGVMDLLGLALSGVILQIAQVIPEVLIMFQAISRKMEILFRAGLAPIALPDIYNGISNSKAIAYIKKFAVTLMTGPLMIVIIKISYNLQANHVAGIINGALASEGSFRIPTLSIVIEMTLYGFAAAGLISSSKTALSDALGC